MFSTCNWFFFFFACFACGMGLFLRQGLIMLSYLAQTCFVDHVGSELRKIFLPLPRNKSLCNMAVCLSVYFLTYCIHSFGSFETRCPRPHPHPRLSGTHSVVQGDLELKEIHLPLPVKCHVAKDGLKLALPASAFKCCDCGPLPQD